MRIMKCMAPLTGPEGFCLGWEGWVEERREEKRGDEERRWQEERREAGEMRCGEEKRGRGEERRGDGKRRGERLMR